jgi:heptosyltransferase-2
MISEVRQHRYDLVINVQRFFLTGLLTTLSGAKETRGFAKNPLSVLFTKRFRHSTTEGLHETERNQALLTGLVNEPPQNPRLYPSEAETDLAAGLVQRVSYTLSPASLWFTKQYPVRKWAELVEQIPREADIFLLGSAGDQALCNEIMQLTGHPGLKNMAGKLTLLQSAALMKRARMNFTNDSAPMHLASAVDAPVTAIYCSTIPGFGFGPLSTDRSVVDLTSPLACRPCGLHGFKACPEKHFTCGYGIDTRLLARRL